jgi:hypothetical protein
MTTIDAAMALPNDPGLLKILLCIWMNEARASLDKARDPTAPTLNLGKRNAYLAEDNVRLTQQNAELAYRIHQLELAVREELEDAVSPSLFKN